MLLLELCEDTLFGDSCCFECELLLEPVEETLFCETELLLLPAPDDNKSSFAFCGVFCCELLEDDLLFCLGVSLSSFSGVDELIVADNFDDCVNEELFFAYDGFDSYDGF